MDVGASYGLGSMAMAMDKQTFGAEVVTKTLDYMNQNQNSYGSSYNADYDFQTTVLSAAYTGKGSMINSLV